MHGFSHLVPLRELWVHGVHSLCYTMDPDQIVTCHLPLEADTTNRKAIPERHG